MAGLRGITLPDVSLRVLEEQRVLAARRGNIRRHGSAMASLFVGALVVAGAFTLLPGRIMHRVVFGG